MSGWSNLLKPDNLPALFVGPVFFGVFIWWWRTARRNDARLASAGLEAVAIHMRGPVPERSRTLGKTDDERVHTWPYLLRIELLVSLAYLILLVVWSILADAPLEQEADATRTPNPSKAPWYFLGLQELLVYFDPWIAGVVLPVLIVVGLALIPYLDPNPEGDGFYCWRPRRLALTGFWSGMALWIALIAIGTVFRGPGWNWYWPWETWDPHLVVDVSSRNWPTLFGVTDSAGAFVVGGLTVLGYYMLGVVGWLWIRQYSIGHQLGPTRFFLIAFFALTMGAIPLKMILRWGLAVKYVWVTPWFNI